MGYLQFPVLSVLENEAFGCQLYINEVCLVITFGVVNLRVNENLIGSGNV